MQSKQAIPHPHGITVMGSAVIYIAPDMASLHFDVSRVEAHPRDAFRATREAEQAVREYLAQAAIDDVATSRILLRQEYDREPGRSRQPRGYRAEIDFNVVLHAPQLDRLEDILAGVVDAGAHDIRSVRFETSRLKEFSVRKILGASVFHVTKLVNREFVWLLVSASVISTWSAGISFFVLR